MQTTTLSDYDDAFAKYRHNAIKLGARDVIQCGSVRDPGVSDIDCILIVDNWSLIKKAVHLLNPECISPLFSHGPFVCLPAMLSELIYYSTLRPIGGNINLGSLPITPWTSRLLVANRQSNSLLHLVDVISSKTNDRQAVLILKSALHSMCDCSVFFDEFNSYHKEISDYEKALNTMRLEIRSGSLNQLVLEQLRRTARQLIVKCQRILASWVRNEFNQTNADDALVLKWFSDLKFSTDIPLFNFSQDQVKEIFRLQKFVAEVDTGYFSYGALWRGAEYPFHLFDSSKIGNMRWVRRFIKRVVVPTISINF